MYYGAVKLTAATRLMELNPIYTEIKDLQQRTEALRGYL